MNKKNLFSKLNQKNSLDKNIIISFINEIISMNNLLKDTYLCIKFENALFNFLENIIKEIAFDSQQLNEINIVLKEHKAKKESIKLNTKTSKEFLASINEALNKQRSLYEQYKVVLDSSEDIVIDSKHYSKNTNKLLSKEIINNMEYGTKVHEILEYIDFLNPNYELIEDNNIRKKIENFINNKLFKGFKDCKIYKEYEFSYNKDNEKYHGIVDLMMMVGLSCAGLSLVASRTRLMTASTAEQSKKFFFGS